MILLINEEFSLQLGHFTILLAKKAIFQTPTEQHNIRANKANTGYEKRVFTVSRAGGDIRILR